MFIGQPNLPTQASDPQIDLIVERLNNSQGLDDLITSLDAFTELQLPSTIKHQTGSVLVPILSQLLRAEYGDENVAQRVLSVLIDLCDAKNSLIFLSEPSNFEVLLECLGHKNILVQIHTIQLLTSLLHYHREKVEQLLLSCNLGLRRLMDIVAVGDQVHVKVRNDMLSLLNALTKNNDRIKEFMSFSQGFELLFDIIDQEQSAGQLCLDCLDLAKNLLSDNSVTKKMFAQSPVVSRLPDLISTGLLVPPSSTASAPAASDPDPTRNMDVNSRMSVEVLTRCQYTIDLVLELLSCMGAGQARVKLLTSLSSDGGDGNGDGDDDGNNGKAEANPNTHLINELQQLQTAICSPNLLCSLLEVACTLAASLTARTEDAATQRVEATLTGALDAVSALICGCAPNQAMLLSCKMVLPWGSQRVVTNVGSLAIVLEVYANVRSNHVHVAALGVLSAFFCLNGDAKISIVGHAIAPPPADLDGHQDRGLPHSESPGRMIVDTFTADADALLLNGKISSGDSEAAQFRLNASCNILETVCADNITCKELLLRVKVTPSSKDALTPSSPQFFLDHCFRLIRSAMSDTANKTSIFVGARLLRLVAAWSWQSSSVVDTMFQSATHLSVLADVFKKHQSAHVAVAGAVLLSVCVATDCSGNGTQNSSVHGFLENVISVERLHDMLDRAVSECVEREAVVFVKEVRRAATEKLVQRYTTGGSGGSGGSGGGVMGEEVQRLRERVRSLEAEQRSSADLFVLLAHLDLENCVLVKHLQNLGGIEALNLAKEEARRLLKRTK